MKKIRFGIIGTNVITEKFIEGLRRTDEGMVSAVYSRTIERGQEFANKHGIPHVYADLEQMVRSEVVDAVYIASPNALHAQQAILCMRYGKHVLCEKLFASNTYEVEQMMEASNTHDVILMEAIKNIHLHNFREIEKNIEKIGKVRKYFASFCQYSSRYDAFRRGEVLNAFKPELSNGALVDIGVYCIAPMIRLFGMPQSIQARGVKLSSGVDGEGSILFGYEEMTAVVQYSKISNSKSPSEIQGEDGTIWIDKISQMREVELIPRKGEAIELGIKGKEEGLYEEIEDFISLIKNNDREKAMDWLQHSHRVMRVIDEARRQLGVVYPADTYLTPSGTNRMINQSMKS